MGAAGPPLPACSGGATVPPKAAARHIEGARVLSVNVSFASGPMGCPTSPGWPQAASPWQRSYPAGLRGLLNWVAARYKGDIYVTENGYSDKLGNIDDLQR